MANKRPRRKPRAASDEDASATTPGASKGRSWPPASSPAEGPPGPRRDIRPFLYAGFDFAMAGVYALLMIQAPTRHPAHAALLWGTVVAVALAGVGMLWRSRWGWRAAVTGCTALLVIAVVVLVLILLSASFLSGVYGSMGRGASWPRSSSRGASFRSRAVRCAGWSIRSSRSWTSSVTRRSSSSRPSA